MIQNYPDLVTFKTEYVQEIPIFDKGFESIIQNSPCRQITFRKFDPVKFSVQNNDPLPKFVEVYGVQLSFGIEVMSQIFTHELNLNKILSQYSQTNGNMTDQQLQQILDCVTNMKPNIKLFNVEKLLDILFDVFQQTTSKLGSSIVLEAILNLIQSLFNVDKKSNRQGANPLRTRSKIGNQLRILSDYLQRKFSNKDDACLYPKMLFQMIEFSQ